MCWAGLASVRVSGTSCLITMASLFNMISAVPYDGLQQTFKTFTKALKTQSAGEHNAAALIIEIPSKKKLVAKQQK